jgi:DNA-binding IclR family transcriptional regulator
VERLGDPGETAFELGQRLAWGTVIASVSASGPSFRIPATRIPALAAAVRQAADEVSGRLGWIAR